MNTFMQFSFDDFKRYLIACGEINNNTEIASVNPVYKNRHYPEKGVRYFSVKVSPIVKNKNIPKKYSTIKVTSAAIKAWEQINL